MGATKFQQMRKISGIKRLKSSKKIEKTVNKLRENLQEGKLEKELNYVNKKLTSLRKTWRVFLINEEYKGLEWQFDLIRANLNLVNLRRIQTRIENYGKEVTRMKENLDNLQDEIKRLTRKRL